MKRVNVNRFKAKIRQYRMQKNIARDTMQKGDVNHYIKDLITLYNTKSQLSNSLIPISVREN